MRLLYVAKIDISKSNLMGVKNKVLDTLAVLRKHFDADILYLSKNFVYLNENPIGKAYLGSIFAIRMAYYEALVNVMKTYDGIYVRNFIADKKSIDIFSKFMGVKVLELPTNIEALLSETTNPVGKMLIEMYQVKFLKQFDLMAVCGKPSNFEISARIPMIEFQNGISIGRLLGSSADTNDIGIAGTNTVVKREETTINLIGVANVSCWHGYDRVIKGLGEYYKTYQDLDIYFHIVGDGPEIPNLKKLANVIKVNQYVIFHGTKTGEELDKVVDECDIAFGSLGNHRKGLYADSALKNREYCARGIPFVIASEDQDFPETFPFVYRIPKDDTPVDINQVIKWYESLIKEHPNYSMEMRKYAEQNLSWDAKMKPVIEKIKELAREKERKTNT